MATTVILIISYKMGLSLVNSSLHVLYVYVNCTLIHYILHFIMFVEYQKKNQWFMRHIAIFQFSIMAAILD